MIAFQLVASYALVLTAYWLLWKRFARGWPSKAALFLAALVLFAPSVGVVSGVIFWSADGLQRDVGQLLAALVLFAPLVAGARFLERRLEPER